MTSLDPARAGDNQQADALALLRSAGSHPIVRGFPQGALIVFDADLRYLSAGGLGLADVGLSQAMLEGKTIAEVFPPSVVSVIEPLYRLALAGTESAMDVPYEGRIYLQRLGPLRDAGGVVVAGMGFTQDVTAARASERALRESEERFRSAFEYAPIGKVLIGLDGRHQQVNAAFCRLTGYTDAQLLAMTVTDITHPADYAADAAVMERLLADEVATITMEKRYLSSAGDSVWAACSMSLVRRGDDSPLHFIAQVQDISARKEQDRLLAEERRRLRDAQFIGRFGFWDLTIPDGNIIWSDTLFALYGLDARKFAGDYVSALNCIHPGDRNMVGDATQLAIDSGAPLHVRYRVTRADTGVLRWFDAKGEGVYEDGQLVRLTGAVADVTELVLAESAAEAARDAALEASRQKSAFLATMSHEIRTPMNAVIGLTGLLLDTDLDAVQRDFVETVRDSGDALLTIINDILDFSKIESGELELEREPFHLWECIEGAVELLGSVAANKGLNLVSYLNGSPQWVVGDPSRLRQVLVNLLGNAIKFTAHGDVVLEVSPQESAEAEVRLRVAVTDTGIGIPRNRLDRLFASFSQVDASTTRVYGGTGLGLAISQRLVQAMGGNIVVTSEEGAGSEFRFTVSLGPCARPPDRAGPALMAAGTALQGRTALLVADNPTNMRILRLQLEGWGLRCTFAGNSAETLALMTGDTRYDVAVIDMTTSMMTGRELTEQLRELPTGKDVPVVLLSSMGERLERRGSSDIVAVLMKPVKTLRLQAALVAALGGAEGTALSRPRRRAGETPVPPVQLRILLAEDNPVNQRVAKLMLNKLGHRVDTVSNGAEAVRAMHRVPYDVVLMDVQMPQMDGLEATRRIRAELGPDRQPRIVAMTAGAVLEDRQTCLAAGMDAYLAKPVHAAELADLLNGPRFAVVPRQLSGG